MITYYGYKDGSGEYFISIDSDKCNGCGECIEKCPKKILKLETVMINLEDKLVSSVKEEFRRQIKYVCNNCHPDNILCVLSCKEKAITTIWNQER